MVNKEKLLAIAQKFISKGQIQKAISEYETLVEAFPKDVRNRQKLAELLSRDKRDEESLKQYEAVARHYTETGFYLKAIAVFKQMQKIEPARLDIYNRLAELNEKQGLVGNALTEYRSLVACYEKQQMYQEAAEALEKMLKLDPENLIIATKIAECHMALDQKDLAFEKFQAVVEAYATKGDHAKVIKLYDHFLGICPEDGVSRLPLARALLGSGSYAKALQILKNLVKHSPEYSDINRCLVDAYVAVEDYTNARFTLNHLLKQHENDPGLREYYVRVCIDAGETKRARERLEEWKDFFFQNERLSVLRGFYEELQSLLPGDPEVAATLSEIHEALGDQASHEQPDASAQFSAEAPETATNAVLEMAIDDVETLDMVGEEASSDVGVPPLDALAADAGLATEKPPAEEIELDLDLDDLDVPFLQVEDAIPPEKAELALPADADEDMEVELEVDLDEMDDFELDFDDGSALAETDTAEETLPTDSGEEADVELEAGEAAIAEGQEIELELPASEAAALADLEDLAMSDADGLDGFVCEEQLETEPADQAEVLTSDDDQAENGHPETFLADEEPDVAALELDSSSEEFGPAGEELDSPVEELGLAGEELDLTGAELGHTGEETGFAAEDFFSLDEELEALEDVAAAPEAGGLKIEAELEEVQFFLQQGLFDDAESLVHTLIESRPELPELQAELAGIERARQAAESEVEGDAFVDLMSDLQDDDLLEATGFLDSFADGGHVDDDLSQKLVSELDSADTESHYNLGIAYKEMGLYDEAIAEFDKAATDPARNLDCITLTGQCHMETGASDAALAVFKGGLANPELSDVGRMTLNFEVGMLHQQNGELLEALEYFQLVAEQDTFFREVSDLIRALRKKLGLDDSNDDGPQGNRDRVSYV